MPLLIQKDGRKITTVEEWFRFAPPKKGLRQWKEGRSAKELAKAFLEKGFPAVPTEILGILPSNPEFIGVDFTTAFPEHKIALDKFPGETRNADIALLGHDARGTVAVTIEAKADEPFGSTIAEAVKGVSARSNLPQRIERLATAVLGHADAGLDALRYQLLHATAASLIFAKDHDARAAVFIVFEFVGPPCLAENLSRNSTDLDLFLGALCPGTPALTAGDLSGPFSVPGGDRVPSGLPLYVGKAARILP
jgi:hypothetical protein